MRIGELIHPYPDEDTVGLIVDFVSHALCDQWVVFSENEIFHIPVYDILKIEYNCT